MRTATTRKDSAMAVILYNDQYLVLNSLAYIYTTYKDQPARQLDGSWKPI